MLQVHTLSSSSGSSVTVLGMGGTIDKDYPRTTKGYAFEIDEPAASRVLEVQAISHHLCCTSQSLSHLPSEPVTSQPLQWACGQALPHSGIAYEVHSICRKDSTVCANLARPCPFMGQALCLAPGQPHPQPALAGDY